MKKLRVLDLFSGIGGFSLGLERTGGFETVAFCEIEEFPRKVLAKHWPDVPIYEDVQNVTAERLAADGIAVDVICGGFPCQDISTAGKGAGIEGERSGLWREYARLIDELGPKWAIIENVPALRGKGLSAVLQNLSEIGYDAEWHCIPASYFGAPHKRDRIWIVSHPNSRRSAPRSDGGGREAGADFSGRSAGANVAYTKKLQRNGGGEHTKQGERQIPKSRNDCSTKHMADTKCIGREQVVKPVSCGEKSQGATSAAEYSGFAAGWQGWEPEPDVGRVANGVPRRVDRLRGLGNAVIPQIPEMIGHAILAAEAECNQ